MLSRHAPALISPSTTVLVVRTLDILQQIIPRGINFSDMFRENGQSILGTCVPIARRLLPESRHRGLNDNRG